MDQNSPKWFDMTVKTAYSGPKWFEMGQNGLKWSKTVQHGPKLPEVV
jgi:hypothetical protein